MKSEITDEILNSKKYAHIERNVIERLCTAFTPRYAKRKDLIKAIKKELHIIHESFLQEDCHLKADKMIEEYAGGDMKADKEFAVRLMSLHASTKERLEQAEEIYHFIGKYINEEDRVIDIGCGFNPFALPLLAVRPKNYVAFDINLQTIQTLNRYFASSGLPYQAEIYDAVAQVPNAAGEVLFLFKLFPLLERQEKGRAFELIKLFNCRTNIISFPLKSASGKEKGMEQFYTTLFENALPAGLSIIEKIVFANEMFYAVTIRHCEEQSDEAIQ